MIAVAFGIGLMAGVAGIGVGLGYGLLWAIRKAMQ
jgi:F0F1-type ATP synthase membrane subunit c/vacuolar-type H+-ATPase subunit K